MRIPDSLTTPRRYLIAVTAAYLVAWLFPSAIVGLGPLGGDLVLDGVGATRLALSPIWPLPGFGTDGTWWGLTLSVMSAMTNVVFVLVVTRAWRRTSAARLTAMARERELPFGYAVWVVAASAVVNLFWLFAWYLEDLREGYYLWLLAFVALASVLAMVRRRISSARPDTAPIAPRLIPTG